MTAPRPVRVDVDPDALPETWDDPRYMVRPSVKDRIPPWAHRAMVHAVCMGMGDEERERFYESQIREHIG